MHGQHSEHRQRNRGAAAAELLGALLLGALLLAACRGEDDAFRTDPGAAACQQAVKVEVYVDLNGDGQRGEDEPPLSGVMIMIAPRENPADAQEQITNQNGRAYFPTRELANCQPAGYLVLLPRQVAGYEFPASPIVDLNAFDPLVDQVEFGLRPLDA